MSERSENPLHASFWFGRADPRPLALFRIGLGLTLLHDLGNYATNLRAFATDDGMLPRASAAIPGAYPLFYWVGTPGAVGVLFAFGIAAVLAFTVGFHTRLATILSWLFMTCLDTRNLYVTDGGDDLVRYLLFLSVFADLGARHSLDARRSSSPRQSVPALGLRFLRLHVALLYFCASRLKFRAGWLTHNVIYQCLQLTGFVRPPGHLLLRVPSLCFALGVTTLVLEFLFAFLAFSPFRVSWCRALAILCGVLVQGGILATMRVGIFTETMLVAMFLFVQPEWLDGTFPWSPAATPARAEAPSAPGWSTARPSWQTLVLLAFLTAQFVSVAWAPFIGRRVRTPRPLVAMRTALWLDQPFGLFDVVYDIPRWEVRGTLPDGRIADVLPVAVPELVPRVAWSFSRWYKFTFKERERPFLFPELSRYFCAEYQRNTGVALTSLEIFETLTPPLVAGEAARPARTRSRYQGSCAPPGGR